MPKRKRSPPSVATGTAPSNFPTNTNTDTEISHRRKRASEKIHHGKKLLHRALKTAKGFERQRLGKRQKLAIREKNHGDFERFRAEVKALGSLDLNFAAQNHLSKSILKDKALREAEGFPHDAVVSESRSESAYTMNILARLYNTKNVKEALVDILDGLRFTLGVESAASAVVKNTDNPIKDSSKDGETTEELDESELHDRHAQTMERIKDHKPAQKSAAVVPSGEDDVNRASLEHDSISEKGRPRQSFEKKKNILQPKAQDDANNGVEQSQNFLSKKDPYASDNEELSNSDDGEAETSSPENDSRQAERKKARRNTSIPPDQDLASNSNSELEPDKKPPPKYNPLKDFSLSPSLSPSRSPSPPPPRKNKNNTTATTTTATKPNKNPTDSKFLPSLTMAGYISGSESSADDDNDVPRLQAPKKNRRGQRARQQIWEQKYGKKAKHLQNNPNLNSNPNSNSNSNPKDARTTQDTRTGRDRGRDADWDAKRGAIDNDNDDNRPHKRKHHGRAFPTQRGPQMSGSNSIAVAARAPSASASSSMPLGSSSIPSVSSVPLGSSMMPSMPKPVSNSNSNSKTTAMHPSWEAARKAKEKKQVSFDQFKGKKVTFD